MATTAPRMTNSLGAQGAALTVAPKSSGTQVASGAPVFDPVPLTPQNAVDYLTKRQGVKAIHGVEHVNIDGAPMIRVHFTDMSGMKSSADIWQEQEGLYGEW